MAYSSVSSVEIILAWGVAFSIWQLKWVHKMKLLAEAIRVQLESVTLLT